MTNDPLPYAARVKDYVQSQVMADDVKKELFSSNSIANTCLTLTMR